MEMDFECYFLKEVMRVRVLVEKVERSGKTAEVVEIEVRNVLFRFFRTRNGRIAFSKSKPGVQVYDPAQLWVPENLFKKAIRQASTILSR